MKGIRVLINALISRLMQFMNRLMDSAWQSGERRIWIQTDCSSIAELINGRSVLDDDVHKPVLVRCVRMVYKLACAGWRALSDNSDMLVWTRREFNAVADHSANFAMDSASNWQFVCDAALTAAMQQRKPLRLCFDGARR